MIIGNVKSHEDLRKKKQLQQDLLEVEVSNEAEMEKRVKDYKNPYVAKPVPPKYKTRAELMKDVMGLTDAILAKFKDIDVPYDIAKGAIMEFSNDPDSLVRLNALFPSIRRKILEATIPSLLTSEMILDIARPILRRSELAYGFAIDKPSFKSPQELESIYGISEHLKALKNDVVGARGETNASLNTETGQVIQELIDIYPDLSFFESLGSPDISEEERNRYFAELENAFQASGIPTMDICEKLSDILQDAEGIVEKNHALKAIRRAVSNATKEKLANLARTIERIEGQVEGASERQEQVLSRRHIEQFGDRGARARAEAQGEGSGEESDEEREGEFKEEVRLTKDLRRVTDEEYRKQEIASEIGKLQMLKDTALSKASITRDQRQLIEILVSITMEGIRQFGDDVGEIDYYVSQTSQNSDEVERLESIISPEQARESYAIVESIITKLGLIPSQSTFLAPLPTPVKRKQNRGSIDEELKQNKEQRQRKKKGEVIDDAFAGLELPTKPKPKSLSGTASGLLDEGAFGISKAPQLLFLRPPQNYEEVVSKREEYEEGINKSFKKKSYDTSPYKLEEFGEFQKAEDIKRLEADLLGMNIEALSSLKPNEKKVLKKIVEKPSPPENSDDEESLADLQSRIGLSGIARLQPTSQRKVEDAVEARENVADYVANELGEAKDPAMPISEAQAIADDALEDVLKALASSAPNKAEIVYDIMAEAKEGLAEPYTEAKPQSKAKPKPARPPAEASPELFPPVPKKPPSKAEEGVKAYFQPTAESLASKSARNQKIIKEAKEYFKDEFLPELKSRTEAEQRALLRNIVIKVRSDTGDQYNEELPDLKIFDKPLTKTEERNVLTGLEAYYFQRQEAERGLYNNVATGGDPPLPKRTKRGAMSKAEKEEREQAEASRVKGLKKGLGVKKKPKKKKEEDLESESSSDEEETKKPIPIKKFKSTRIKVGKGIEVVEEPKYRSFGKYVIHIPQLHNNKLNLKYPKSLGTIPSIKPTPISEEYRDFIIDVLDNGKMSEKELKRLVESEQKHFEKIVNGAGLVETFKLKKTISKDEKEEADRFNLLRGEYLAGNNAPTLLKELRSFILKFMDDGRIKRKDGMGLLAELAVSV
jgi:hypothetical protein